MAVEIAIEYLGKFKTRATHGPSGTSVVTVPPVDNQGDGSSFSPTDLAATALATCAMTILAQAAARHGLDLSGATARIEKHMSAEPPRRIVRLPMTISVPSPVPAALRPALEAAARRCPVALSIDPAIDAPIRFEWSAAG